ncbi:hypothetical protein DPMN_123548 [Dreissena polymorpha]|uniref:Uncharacterized protein n=1 Tax=Dreissena polymorpha TaxID=45954 RepID=A0A9D4JRE0_DREPO|nr:hypothetical protein DPMN_123548 [Dreissena polymorpha]
MARQRQMRLVMGPCIVEIDRIIIRETILGGCGLLWAGRPRVGNGAMHKVQYRFEVNRCRNNEILVKGIFGWAWPMWAGCPWVEVQFQFEVNRCRNEEIIVKCNFGWSWPMWQGRPRIDRIVIREAQYGFEVNRCRNEEVNFQGSSANCVGGAGGQDGRTDAHHHNIPTFSPKNVGIINRNC